MGRLQRPRGSRTAGTTSALAAQNVPEIPSVVNIIKLVFATSARAQTLHYPVMIRGMITVSNKNSILGGVIRVLRPLVQTRDPQYATFVVSEHVQRYLFRVLSLKRLIFP